MASHYDQVGVLLYSWSYKLFSDLAESYKRIDLYRVAILRNPNANTVTVYLFEAVFLISVRNPRKRDRRIHDSKQNHHHGGAAI